MPDRKAEPPAHGTSLSVRAFVLRFLLAFAGLEVLVYLVLWQDRWFAPYAAVNARVTALLLAPFLDGVAAAGGLLTSPTFSVQVRPGCDAYQAGAVLLAGVLAFPATTAQRLWGATVGLASLQILNLLRLAVLLRAGQHDHALFERMHLEILPLVFVAAALGLLFGWCLWTRRRA
ncbi:MAG TPA: hypothetical protein VF530_08310 [Planctomycetota bacterium]